MRPSRSQGFSIVSISRQPFGWVTEALGEVWVLFDVDLMEKERGVVVAPLKDLGYVALGAAAWAVAF